MEKTVADLVIIHGQVLTMTPHSHTTDQDMLGIIDNGAVAAFKGKIVWVGKIQQLQNHVEFTKDYREIDASNKIVCPCFIDAHTHLTGYPYGRADDFMQRVYGTASYASIAQKGGGILTTVSQTRNATNEQLLQWSQQILQEFLRHGVGTVEGKSGYLLDKEGELRQLQLLQQLNSESPVTVIPTYLVHMLPKDYQGQQTDYVNYAIAEILPQAAQIAHSIDVFCDAIAFNTEESRQILQAGINHKLIAGAHVEQTSAMNSVEILASLGVKHLSHLEHVSPKGIELMAKYDIVGILFPSCSLYLDAPFAPARQMLERGVKIALSTDWNPGSSPCSNLLLVAYFAAKYLKMPPVDILRALTIHPAQALQCESILGSIEVGKKADIAVFSIRDWRDLVSQCGNTPEVLVVKDGQVYFM